MKPCDYYKKIILGGMREVLKPHGFRKQGAVFRADRGDVLLIVALQSSTSTTALSLKATVNLGVFSLALRVRDGHPTVWDAHWQERLGFLLPEPHDRWWTARSREEAEQAQREISELLQEQALPLLESLASNKALISLWSTGRSPGFGEKERLIYLDRLQGA